MDQHIDLARLAINATTTSNNATILHKSIKPRPSPRPCYATRSSLAVVYEVDASRSALEPSSQHQLQNDAPMGENDAVHCHRTIRKTQI
jgi:hypothetical protein